MSVIAGYVPPIGEDDPNKISRAIRNIYENLGTFGGPVTITGTLGVTGDVAFTGNLTITGNITSVSGTTPFLRIANNLSDVTAATARTNLGLGTAAVQNVAAFLQPSNNLSDVSSVATSLSNLGLLANNNVGTIAFCYDSVGTGYNFGDTAVGGDLVTTNEALSTGTALSGTWRCLGALPAGVRHATSFVRIA